MNAAPSVYYHLGNHRELSVRFRLVWQGAAEPRFESMNLTRPFGLPIGDGVGFKPAADVLLIGSAFPRRVGDTSSEVSLRCGAIERKLQVLGPREAIPGPAGVQFSPAATFERVRLDHTNAYGGGLRGDRRYPRNPAGKGFITRDRLTDQRIDLPQVEEGARLTPDNLIAEWESWWLQPQPALVESLLPTNMPRLWHLGGAELYPLPSAGAERSYTELLQEAPPQSRVQQLAEGTLIEVDGCLAGGARFRATAPRAPRFVLTVDGKRLDAEVRPQTIRVRPEAGELSITYGVEHQLDRTFLPGVHARIPITTEVEGLSVPFPVEEPLLRQLRRARDAEESKS